MAIKFAYVRYLEDGKRDIVPVSYFKKFSPKDCRDFESTKAYLVQWKEDVQLRSGDGEFHYKAQILMLAATEREIEEKVKNSRVKVAKVLDTSVEESSSSSESENEVSIQQATISKQRKEKKRDQTMATNEILRAIVAQNLAKKKAAPLFSPSLSSKLVDCSCGYAAKYQEARKRCRKAEADNDAHLATIKKLKEKESAYLSLNQELQVQLLQQLKGKVPVKPVAKITSEANTKKDQLLEEASSGAPAINISLDGDQTKRQMYEEKDGKIYIAENVSITKGQWEAVRMQKRHSLFVRDLAVAVWGTEVLKDRSVEGKVCPRFKDQRGARAPLSPVKLTAIKDCFSDRLDELGVSASEKQKELQIYKKYISAKIQDINRLIRRKDN